MKNALDHLCFEIELAIRRWASVREDCESCGIYQAKLVNSDS